MRRLGWLPITAAGQEMLGLYLFADAKCLLQEVRVPLEGSAEMARAGVPRVEVVLVMAVLVRRGFALLMLVGGDFGCCIRMGSLPPTATSGG